VEFRHGPDTILSRFDRVLLAFEHAYLGKWADEGKEFTDTDEAWLKRKVTEKLDPEIADARSRCNTALYNKNTPGAFAGFWQNAEQVAIVRRNKMFDKIEILKLQKRQVQMPHLDRASATPDTKEFPNMWDLMHPAVVKVSKTRFDSGHFADAVEAALKEVNEIVRNIVRDRTGKEYDGADLMNRAFSIERAIIALDDLNTTAGRNIQVGYMQICSGAMTGIRNPKAHSNVQIDSIRGIHLLFLASLICFKIDERVT
jgi:uncharacterized protein (TIGR02391 family)